MQRRTYLIPVSVTTESGSTSTIYGLNDDALIMSQNHHRDKHGIWNGGGPFMTRHRRYEPVKVGPLNWYSTRQLAFTPFIGTYLTTPPTFLTHSELDSLYTTTYNSAWAYGATGWKRTRPGNPVAHVAQFTGELLFDSLPQIPFNVYNRLKDLLNKKNAFRRLNSHNVGNEYLNAVFGWAPLLSDLRKMYNLYHSIDKRLAQIRRDNGKGIHRRTVIKDSSTSTVSTTTNNFAFFGWNYAPSSDTVQGYGRVDTIVSSSEKVWFVGKYRYYIPDIDTVQWTRRMTATLFGVRITPEVVWELLPWSWLADWFGNIGDVVSNASDPGVDNLTADYAYVMRTVSDITTVEASASWKGVKTSPPATNPTFYKDIPAGSVSASARSHTITKTRSIGSPFGFGATFDSLSNYQVGVAAALGISRSAFT